jgi:hypothetical protein
MSANDEGFFSRWSRRKALARAGQSLPPEEGRPPEPMAELAPGCPPSVSPAVDRAVVPVDDVAQVEQGREGSSQPPAPATSPPPPTLEDVRQLTLDADFRPFVDRRVPPEVRNAALRKLFSDPHFNVMDGLDVYIDDYSRPDPLPIETARRMVAGAVHGVVRRTARPRVGEVGRGRLPCGQPRTVGCCRRGTGAAAIPLAVGRRNGPMAPIAPT